MSAWIATPVIRVAETNLIRPPQADWRNISLTNVQGCAQRSKCTKEGIHRHREDEYEKQVDEKLGSRSCEIGHTVENLLALLRPW